MSLALSRLVRAVRMPAAMKRKPACKGVLLALADDAQEDGCAFTSVGTMSLEAAVSARTVDACLADLQTAGLISLEAPARQHRPKTWRLNLPALAKLTDSGAAAKLLTDSQLLATLEKLDPQLLASLKAQAEPSAGSQHAAGLVAPDPQLADSDPQNFAPGSQHVATELLNIDLNVSTPPRTADALAREPGRNGNRNVIYELAKDVLREGRWVDGNGDTLEITSESDLVDALKWRCARERIDYGRHEDVDVKAVHRAAAAAWHLSQIQRITQHDRLATRGRMAS